MSDVTSAEVLEVLTPVWHVKAQTARRVRERIRAVLEWAVAMEYRSDNPCDRIAPVLGPQQATVAHMLALAHQDVPAALARVRASGAAEIVRLAFEFLVLTAGRWGEVRGAAWTEIDDDAAVWTIPAARMKAKRPHRVPLPERTAEILEAARSRGDGPLVFPGRDGAPLADKRLRRLLQQQGIASRAARLPVHLPRLGGRGDRPSARGHRGGAGARRAKQGRSGLCPLGPVRAPPAAHGRLGGLSERDASSGCVQWFRSRHQTRGGSTVMTLPTHPREPRPPGRRLEHALTPAFVRTVATAGRYGDGRRRSRATTSSYMAY